MKMLSFDQSTSCSGVSCYDDATYQWTKVIDMHKNKNTNDRFAKMVHELINIINTERPDLIVIENTAMQSSPQTLIILAQLQGCLIGAAIDRNIRFEVLLPSQWRKLVQIKQGKKKREELKWESLNLATSYFSKDFTEDGAESALIGLAYLIQEKMLDAPKINNTDNEF